MFNSKLTLRFSSTHVSMEKFLFFATSELSTKEYPESQSTRSFLKKSNSFSISPIQYFIPATKVQNLLTFQGVKPFTRSSFVFGWIPSPLVFRIACHLSSLSKYSTTFPFLLHHSTLPRRERERYECLNGQGFFVGAFYSLVGRGRYF